MKKRRILGILLCCALVLTFLAACNDSGGGEAEAGEATPDAVPADPAPTQAPEAPPADDAIYVVDFSDGNTDFVKVNLSPRKADQRTSFEVKEIDGASALAISMPGGDEAHIGISLDDILGSGIKDVKMIVLDIYAEMPDGNFSAVGGTITATSGGGYVAGTNWTVYISTRNPNQVVLEFGADNAFLADGLNLLEISCETNGPAEKGETPAIVCIKSIAFYNASNEGIAVDTDGAIWQGPDDYGASSLAISQFALPYPSPVEDDTWVNHFTPGVDGIESDYMPQEALASSFGIVYEMEDPGDGGYTFVYYGSFNGWSWTEVTDYSFYADGKLTIYWDDIGFDPSAFTEEDAVKFQFGNWNGAEITAVYLLQEGDAGGGNILELPYPSLIEDDTWINHFTPGVDGIESDYMPQEALASSYGIVYEMEDPSDGGYTFVYYGSFNGWGWTEVTDTSFYADGKLTIYWDDIGFDPSAFTEEDAVKFQFGNWGGAEITAIYLLMD